MMAWDMPNSTMLLLGKIGAMIILGLGSFTLGVLPLIVGRCRGKRRSEKRGISSNSSTSTNASTVSLDSNAASQGLLTSLLLCFGGGVLLFTTFLHLAPEVRQSVERHQASGQLFTLGSLSVAELLFCIGFFFVYLVEEGVHAALSGKQECSESLLYRTVSVRRCNNNSQGNSAGVTSPTASSTGVKSSIAWTENHCKARNDGAKCGSRRAARLRLEQLQMNDEKTLPTTVFVLSQPANNSDRQISDSNYNLEPNYLVKPDKRQPIIAGNDHHHTHASSLRGLLAVVALSFHAIFEGLAVGLEPQIASVVYLAAAIATHKLVIAFCVGMELWVTGASTRTILGYLSIFSIVTPLGIGAGMALGYFNNDSDNLGPMPTILQGMAAGTLLYVVFFEVLARERANDKSGLLQLAAIMLGFLLMMGLQLLTAHSHSHDGPSSSGHSHEGHTHDDDHNEDDHHLDKITRVTEEFVSAVTNALSTSTPLYNATTEKS